MKKEDLKKILKPLIKECIKEVIFEDGTLSTVITEVMKGLGNPITESRPSSRKMTLESDTQAKNRRDKIMENKKRMLKAMGTDAYNGVDLFEGTTPTPSPGETGRGALSGVAPNDPGVDISSFMGSSGMWKKLAGK